MISGSRARAAVFRLAQAVTRTPATPDFLGDPPPLFLAGLMDDAAGFIVGAAPMLGDGSGLLRTGLQSIGRCP